MEITLNTVLSRSSDVLYAPVGADQAVMMSAKAGMYYGLDAVGSRLWELLESPRTVGQACTQLCEEFEIDIDTCRAEILKFADELVCQGVLHADPARS